MFLCGGDFELGPWGAPLTWFVCVCVCVCVCVPIAHCLATRVFHAIRSCLRRFFVGIVQASLDASQAYAHVSLGYQTLGIRKAMHIFGLRQRLVELSHHFG